MKVNSLVVIAISIFIVFGCSSPVEDTSKKILTLEESLFSDEKKMIDKQKADELIAAYEDFASTYPDNKKSAEYLFKAGDMSMNLNKPKEAIALFERIMNNYPDFDKIPQCLFLKAYVYENSLNDLDNAKKIYEEFIKRFPDDEFADDAEVSLKNLGKSPEELIRQFEENKEE